MNTKEAYDRLAKCGVKIVGYPINAHCPPVWYDSTTASWWMLDRHNDHAEIDEWTVELMLESAWHRKWPDYTCEQLNSAGEWDVFGTTGKIKCLVSNAQTRLEAMVLAAEQAAKEDRTNG